MRPRIFVTEEKIEGLRLLAELRDAIRQGHAKRLWDQLTLRSSRIW